MFQWTLTDHVATLLNSTNRLRYAARYLVLGFALCTLPGLTGCDPAKQEVKYEKGKDIVIFIDFSQSMAGGTKDLFVRDFTDRIIPSLDAGDRILIAPINDKTLTQFHPLVEETLPPKPVFDGWFDNSIKYDKMVKKNAAEVKEVKARIEKQVAEIFSASHNAQQTDILSSLIIAQKLFHNQENHKVLILMSDMIVDYPPYRFDRIAWSKETTEKMLADLGENSLIPDLTGVCVYVSGVSAKTAQMAAHIDRFWQAYFQRTNADMDPSRYAHVLLHWPPSKACDLDKGSPDAKTIDAFLKDKSPANNPG